jgi:signal transduction histidine kinase/HAMP domain-containing protein
MLTVSGLVSVASYLQHQQSSATLSLVHEGYLPLALTVSEARATQSVFGNLLDRMLSERNSSATRAWLNAARRARPATLERALDGVAAIEAMAPPAEDRKTLARLRHELKQVQTFLTQGERRYEDLYVALDRGPADVAQRTLADLQARERAVEGRLRVVWGIVLGRIEDTSERAAAQQQRALAVLLSLVVLALVIGVAVTWWSQRVLSPLPRLQERVEAVARGDLARQLGPDTDDEIGRLGREFERMVAALAARDASLRSASESLRELQRMQAQILADLSAAVLVVDAAGTLRTDNPAAEALFGLGPAAIGAPLSDSGLIARLPALGDAIARVGAGAQRALLDEAVLSGEHERTLNVVVTPFGTAAASGGGRDVLVVAEDVTEAVRTKSRLIQSERLAAIGRMAAHVTHEVRNPLSSIGLNVEMLEEELGARSGEARELLSAIHREIEHLTSVTEEYLRLARLPNPQLEPEELGPIAESTASFLRPELASCAVDLDVEVAEGLPMVALDEAQIRQVLINLLKNAREAMPEGGRVSLSVAAEHDGVVVRITDEGQGMDPKTRERIFDLFYTTKKLGSGLGLPLSQQIVLAHGGVIRCNSTPGHGTTFELWFPVHETERRAEPAA